MKKYYLYALVALLVLVILAYTFYYTIKSNVSFSFGGLNSVDLSQFSFSDLISQGKQLQTTLTFEITNNTPFSLTVSNLQIQASDINGNPLFNLPTTQRNLTPIVIAAYAVTPIVLDVAIYDSANTGVFFLNAEQNVQQQINYTATFSIFGKSVSFTDSIMYP